MTTTVSGNCAEWFLADAGRLCDVVAAISIAVNSKSLEMIRRLGIGILALFAVAILLVACGPTTREDIAKAYVEAVVNRDVNRAAEYWSPVVDGKKNAAGDIDYVTTRVRAVSIKAMDVSTGTRILDHSEFVDLRARIQNKDGQEIICPVRFDFVQSDGNWKIESATWLY